MGWFSNIFKSPEAPKAPDYEKLAEKTATSDAEAARIADFGTRANITGPEGSQTWTPTQVKDPATGQMMTQWSQVNTLNPTAQKTFEAGQQQDLSRMEFGNTLLGGAMDSLGKPIDTSNLQAWNTGPQAGNIQAGNLSAGPQVKAGNLDPSAYKTTGAGKGMMAGLDTDSLGNMPRADAQERQRIEGALFDRMRPEHQQSQAKLEAQLQGMGLTRGSAQWNDEMQRMGDQQSRERFNAMEMGGSEMQRLHGMGLQNRQQGWEELQGAGNFQNAAQQQGFNQRMGANAQNFGMEQTAGAQNFGQNLAATDSNFNRNLQAGNQNFNQNLQAGNQNFNQGVTKANLDNTLRTNQLNEATTLRQMPLNEYNMLTTGAMPGPLQFQQGPAANRPQGTDYLGAGQMTYNAGMDATNLQQGWKQGLMGGGTSILQAGMMMSDARLKSNITRIGTHPLGVGVYEYDIFGRRERGLIAQELVVVAPEHVYTHPTTGYLMIDYGGLSA